jgi:hypothetical protein
MAALRRRCPWRFDQAAGSAASLVAANAIQAASSSRIHLRRIPELRKASMPLDAPRCVGRVARLRITLVVGMIGIHDDAVVTCSVASGTSPRYLLPRDS